MILPHSINDLRLISISCFLGYWIRPVLATHGESNTESVIILAAPIIIALRHLVPCALLWSPFPTLSRAGDVFKLEKGVKRKWLCNCIRDDTFAILIISRWKVSLTSHGWPNFEKLVIESSNGREPVRTTPSDGNTSVRWENNFPPSHRTGMIFGGFSIWCTLISTNEYSSSGTPHRNYFRQYAKLSEQERTTCNLNYSICLWILVRFRFPSLGTEITSGPSPPFFARGRVSKDRKAGGKFGWRNSGTRQTVLCNTMERSALWRWMPSRRSRKSPEAPDAGRETGEFRRRWTRDHAKVSPVHPSLKLRAKLNLIIN